MTNTKSRVGQAKGLEPGCFQHGRDRRNHGVCAGAERGIESGQGGWMMQV